MVRTVKALGQEIRNSRVQILVDNQTVCAAWTNQGVKYRELNVLMKELFHLTFRFNVDLTVYVKSSLNPADQPSRTLDKADAMLVQEKWDLVQRMLGPHNLDLMALTSNAHGIRHFTPVRSQGVLLYPSSKGYRKDSVGLISGR